MSGTCIVKRGKKFTVMAYAGIDPVTRKQRYRWFGGFQSRKDAARFRDTLAHSPAWAVGAGPYGTLRLRTCDYLHEWLDRRAALHGLHKRTVETHQDMIRLHLDPVLGHMPLVRLSPGNVEAVYARMLERGLSPGTVRRAAAVLAAAFEDATRAGLISRNPARGVPLPQPTRRDPAIWTPEHIRDYLADARETATPAVYAWYCLLVGAGLRVGEAAALREEDVDLGTGTLRVARTLVLAGRNPIFGEPKTAKGRRTVLLPDECVTAIKTALRWKKEQRLRVGSGFRDAGTALCTASGRALDRHALRERDHLPRCRRLGLPPIRLHDFRHLHVTYLLTAGVDCRTAADRVGHRDPAFTARTYAHLVATAQESAAAAASELLVKTLPSERCAGVEKC